MAKLTEDIIYVLFLILGVITYYISWNIDSSIAETQCKSSSLKTANKLLLTISVILISISSLSLLGCDQLSTKNKIIYSSVLIVLGILLITLGSIIVSNSGSDSSCSSAHGKGAEWVIVAGIVLLIGSGYSIYSAIEVKSKPTV